MYVFNASIQGTQNAERDDLDLVILMFKRHPKVLGFQVGCVELVINKLNLSGTLLKREVGLFWGVIYNIRAALIDTGELGIK